jgi:hypothetical protein
MSERGMNEICPHPPSPFSSLRRDRQCPGGLSFFIGQAFRHSSCANRQTATDGGAQYSADRLSRSARLSFSRGVSIVCALILSVSGCIAIARGERDGRCFGRHTNY